MNLVSINFILVVLFLLFILFNLWTKRNSLKRKIQKYINYNKDVLEEYILDNEKKDNEKKECIVDVDKEYKNKIKFCDDYRLINGIIKVKKPETMISHEKELPAPKRYYSQHSSKSEEICRTVFNDIFGKEFHTVRPDFLKNPKTNRNLELDGYNHELRLGFEYNGEQHYVYPNPFHKTKQDFDKQIDRDIWKRNVCKSYGVVLVEVPYYIKTYESMKSFVEEVLSHYDVYKDLMYL